MSDKIFSKTNKNRKKKHKRVYEPNYFDSATVIAEFNLLVCAEATSLEWQADHLALAESNMDRTPAVLHAIVSSDSAKILKRFMQANKCLPRGIEGDQELLKLSVESPLDPMNTLVLNICVITIDQCYSSVTMSSWKGKPASDQRMLSNMMMFRNKDVHQECDATMILGRFKDKSLAPKLLLFRTNGMLCNHGSNFSTTVRMKWGADIDRIRFYAGNQGYETRQTCGSSGSVTETTDRNLLQYLKSKSNSGAFPRNITACMLIRGKYHIFYAKTHGECEIAHVVYTPPREGGSFRMPDIVLFGYPVLVEMVFLKTFTICVLRALNKYRYQHGHLMVATGLLSYETKSLELARQQCSHSCSESEKIFTFIFIFNAQNHFSPVAYPVVYHYDYSKERKESIENKLLLVVPREVMKEQMKINSVGRRGSLTCEDYAYAILDW
eukprot:scaffold112761_cov46-Cyclotella_meneghiniana.AAC.5